MSQTVITTAFEQLKAQQAANGGVLLLDEFVFANVPNLNISDPIDRAESWPDASQIVYRQAVSKTGMVNSNAVVYSVVMGAEVGDFEFNWVGLISKASNTVCMIVHAPLQKKIKTASGQQGNVLTRSFLMEFDGASQQTQIITPADTWQIDFTARLGGVDERQRLENIDIYGMAGFLGNGWQVIKNGGAYTVKQGVGYIAGLRTELLADQFITVKDKPSKVWIDACWRGLLTSAWGVVSKITVAPALANYDDNGERHYVFAVAEIAADGTVTDLRPRENKTERQVDEQLDALPEKYLSRAAPFAEIKQDGAAAVAVAQKNLDLVGGLGADVFGRLLAKRTITITGKVAKTPGAKWALIRAWSGAGGGGGAGRTITANYASQGWGGQSGSYIELLLNVADLEFYDCVIGAGGKGGLLSMVNTANAGSDGGSTSIAGVLSCPGGKGGQGGILGTTMNTGIAVVGAELPTALRGTILDISVSDIGAPGAQVGAGPNQSLGCRGGTAPGGLGSVGGQGGRQIDTANNNSGRGGDGKGKAAGGGGGASITNSDGFGGGDGGDGVISIQEFA